ncbi:MAG: FHA domain-containing protein [Deltaproteobacteria bacterium]|nr:FHA domain-containing protein [Deltaproteobacteria bacterium]
MSDTWECKSCGAVDQRKSFCETCGAAEPIESDADDSALSLMLGLVCERCDAYNDPGLVTCVACGAQLPSVDGSGRFPTIDEPAAAVAPGGEQAPDAVTLPPSVAPPAPAAGVGQGWMSAPEGQPLPSLLALPKVDLASIAAPARGAPPAAAPPAAAPSPSAPPPSPAASPAAPAGSTCPTCRSVVTPADRFCRHCGHRMDASAPPSTMQIAAFKLPAPGLPSPVIGGTAMMPSFASPPQGLAPQGAAATMVFGAVAPERTPKLVLVRGHSQIGNQWRLQPGETVVGRKEGAVVFADDRALAPRHCRISWRSGEVWLTPEATTNGVFRRVLAPLAIGPGDEVVVGTQRLRVLSEADRLLHMTSPDPSTRVLGSVVRAGPVISLLHIAPDQREHEVFHRHQRVLSLGRNRCDLNFPGDGFVSERHAQLTRTDEGPLLLEDLRSRNGTYVRVRQPVRLSHGDLLLIGDKVLRVELPR